MGFTDPTLGPEAIFGKRIPPQRPQQMMGGRNGIDSPIPMRHNMPPSKSAPSQNNLQSYPSDSKQSYGKSEQSSAVPSKAALLLARQNQSSIIETTVKSNGEPLPPTSKAALQPSRLNQSPTIETPAKSNGEPQDWRYQQHQGGYQYNQSVSPQEQDQHQQPASCPPSGGNLSQPDNQYRRYDHGQGGRMAHATPSPEPRKRRVDVERHIAELLDPKKNNPQYIRQEGAFRLSYEDLESIMLETREKLMLQPMLLEIDGPVNICGDIHGQYLDLIRIFEKVKMPGKGPDANYLFLGDYVDRGKQSLECCALLFLFKIKYPENFFLLRGNHECPGVNRVYGFYDECKRRFDKPGELRGVKIWKTFIDIFNWLPVSALVGDKILCMHGGLSPELENLTQIRTIDRPCDIPENGLMCDLLWSDPMDMAATPYPPANGWGNNDRGVSYTFTPYVVKEMCKKLNLDLVVRAHQVVEDGYEFFADRKLVTVFSAPNYCGTFDNLSAILIVDQSLNCKFVTLKPTLAINMKRPRP